MWAFLTALGLMADPREPSRMDTARANDLIRLVQDKARAGGFEGGVGGFLQAALLADLKSPTDLQAGRARADEVYRGSSWIAALAVVLQVPVVIMDAAYLEREDFEPSQVRQPTGRPPPPPLQPGVAGVG